MSTHDWFDVRASGATADVASHGEIRAGDDKRFLQAIPFGVREISVHITSEGGDPNAALVIAAGLRGHPARVEITIDGLAASAATLVVMAGDHVEIGRDAAAMIHDPKIRPEKASRPGAGQLREAADALERVKARMLDCYGWKMRATRAELARMMSATTWFDAESAVREGLADAIATTASLPMAACVDATALAELLKSAPPRLAAKIAALSRPRVAEGETTSALYARRNRQRLESLYGPDYARLNARGSR